MITSQQRKLMNSITKILQFFETLKSQTTSATNGDPQTETLYISNTQSKYRLIHGVEFKDMLDPRDIVLQHSFDFKINLTESESYNFLESSEYAQIEKQLKKFLIEAVSNVISVSFKNLNDGKLQEKQALNYAAQNIMANIHSIFFKICKSIEDNPKLTRKITLVQIKTDLISKAEAIINSILINLADNYPQAPITGGTPRMNSVINQINRVDDEGNDLIFSNNIKISDFLKTKKSKNFGIEYENIDFQQEDYTEFIMQTINTVIQVVQSNQYDERQRTNKEIFKEFNEELFCSSQNQNFKELISKLTNQKEIEQIKNKEKEHIVKQFRKITEINKSKYQNLVAETNNEEFTNQLDARKKMHQNNFGKHQQLNYFKPLSQKIASEKEKGIEHLRKDKKYAVAQKIPSYVKKFTRQEIIDKNFRAKHSSILRILTKWAEYLEDIFHNAEKHILMRLYPFKNIHNQLCHIQHEQDKFRLIQRLKQQFRQVKLKLKIIKQKNTDFIAQFLSKQQDKLASNVCRYTQTREISSKINAILTSLMVDYLSILIHHLLKAGQFQGERSVVNYNLNLIVFRVSDILRAKFKCDQSTFVTLLKTIYLLDQQEQMHNTFKIIRIKNKLEDPANNIIINYMFMGKIQCQLQLSIQESKGKQKNYYIFSHFIYQLTRGKFGIISQCATMITQLDPMINACDKLYYVQKIYKEKKINQPEMILRMLTKKQSIVKAQTVEKSTFECKNCQKLTINEQLVLFKAQAEKLLCTKCLIASQNSEKLISNTLLREQLIKNIESKTVRRINKFNEVRCEPQNYSPILNLNSKGLLQMNLLLFRKPEQRYFLVKINSSVLHRIYDKNFQFKKVDYVDISPQYRNKVKIEEMMSYEVSNYENITQNLYKMMGVERQELMIHLSTFIRMFQQFRQQKCLIKSIKFKTQIIKCTQDSSKWQNFKKIVNVYSDNKDRKQNLFKLKYRKYHYVDFTQIKFIQLDKMQLSEFPKELIQCHNLEELVLNNNNFQIFRLSEGLQKLKSLQICKNQLQKLDICILCNLTTLNLSNNNLRDVDGLSSLQNLTKLVLNSNKIQNIQGLSSLNKLVRLQVVKNKLKSTKGLSKLSNLTHLNLKANNISDIEDLTYLTKLQQLDLSFNNLHSIDALATLINLNSLNLNHNHLKNVNDLAKLTNLTNLQLSSNKIQYLHGLEGLINLTSLTLSSNKIQSIQSIRKLLSLITLDLAMNKIQNVDFLSNLINLTSLDLRNNQIYDVSCLHSLVNLKRLNLNSLDLKTSCSFESFKKLHTLDIMENKQLQVLDLPSSLRFLFSDFKAIQNVDFNQLHNLRQIKIKGHYELVGLKNLSERVKVQTF